MVEMGRNICYSAVNDRYYVVQYWDGVEIRFWFDTKLKATRAFNKMHRDGVQWVNPHQDTTI